MGAEMLVVIDCKFFFEKVVGGGLETPKFILV